MNVDKILRAAALKVTKARKDIYGLLARSKSPLRADDIYHQFKIDGNPTSLATIYRVLLQLEQVGLLSKHHFDSTTAWYELVSIKHHDHLRCLDCGQFVEFYNETIEQKQKEVARQLGFTMVDHTLNIQGHCQQTNCDHKQQQTDT